MAEMEARLHGQIAALSTAGDALAKDADYSPRKIVR